MPTRGEHMSTKETRRKYRKINNWLIIVLLCMIPLTAGAFIWNLWQISHTNAGEGETLAGDDTDTETVNEFHNDFYTIGNNSTKINKDSFRELNNAITAQDPAKISEALTKCFVTEYYTWTNKDGNYDIGGMQYIYTPMSANFAEYSLWNFYEDMDLYITQYGRDKLIEVTSVTAEPAVSAVYEITGEDGNPVSLEAYTVKANWEYGTETSMDTSQMQKSAVFTVVNNNGRWEIAAIGQEVSQIDTESHE
jgi:hypothetical protein